MPPAWPRPLRLRRRLCLSLINGCKAGLSFGLNIDNISKRSHLGALFGLGRDEKRCGSFERCVLLRQFTDSRWQNRRFKHRIALCTHLFDLYAISHLQLASLTD
jgi:hypothetical protein